ncbi:hypothetical protein CsatB_012560 [Cannabis sativa]
MYDEKQNRVTIKVVCCCPEKIKQKIICKAGDSLISIEIIKVKVPDIVVPPNTNNNKNNPNNNMGKIDQKEKPGPVPISKVEVEIEVLPPCGCQGGQFLRRCCKECLEGRRGGPCWHGQPCQPCHQHDGCWSQCHWGRPPTAPPCDDKDCYLVFYQQQTPEPCSIM